MDDNKKVDELVDMLDSFMNNGGGHMNVAVNDINSDTTTVQTMNSNECAGQNMACKVPTLHVGIDDAE